MPLYLSKMLRDHKIFLDSSALLSEEYKDFWDRISPELIKQKSTVLIPVKAFVEAKLKGTKRSKDVISELQRLYKLGLIEFVGSQKDIEQEDLYPKIFKTLSEKYKILFITQDWSLASKVYDSTKKSLHPVTLARFSSDSLLPYESLGSEQSLKTVNSLVLGPFAAFKKKTLSLFKKKIVAPEESFALSKTLTSLPEKVIRVRSVPEEGDTAYTESGPLVLKQELATGGEGKIYETDTGLIAKVYKKERITERRKEKINLMLSKPIKYPGICYPLEILYNKDREFIGYTMPRAFGKELQRSVFVKKLLKKNFPDWTKKDTVTLALTILDKIIYLNSHGIIMGDINPMNILVVSPTEVYFVDTDSYQIEDFPCPVGTVNFTAPEIQGVSFSEFLRTMAHERFAIATLMFMLMLPGKPPYSQRGGEGPQQNIINMDFSYPYLDFYNGKTPKGPWAAMWSHLPDAVQEAFFHSFRKEAYFSGPDKRLTGEDWYTLFSEYLELLNDPLWEEIDKEALLLFPSGFRVNDLSRPKIVRKKKKAKKKEKLPICKSCGQTFGKDQLRAGLCPDCLKKEEEKRLNELKRQAIFNRPNINVNRTPKPKTTVRKTKKTVSQTSSSPDKTLICRKCRKSYPDYEMKAGLCPTCRANDPTAVPKTGFQKKQEEKELICRSCHGLYPAKEMQGGLCPNCRKRMGIKDRARPVMTIGGENGIQGTKSVQVHSSSPKSDMTLFCRKCHKTYPDYEMKGGLCPACRGEKPTVTRTRRRADTKELICRGCHKTFPDYEMKGGLCESCRGISSAPKRTRTRILPADPYNPSRDRMFRCEDCGLTFPVSELSGGVCASCRKKRRDQKNTVLNTEPRYAPQPKISSSREPDHGFNRNRGNSRRYYSNKSSQPEEKPSWKERFTQQNWSPKKETTVKSSRSEEDVLNLNTKPKEVTRREKTKEALNGIFKDTPIDKLNDFVSWLIDKNN